MLVKMKDRTNRITKKLTKKQNKRTIKKTYVNKILQLLVFNGSESFSKKECNLFSNFLKFSKNHETLTIQQASILNRQLFSKKLVSLDSHVHCMKNVRIRSYSSPHFPALGLNTDKLRIQSKCGKMWTRIDPNMDTFYAVVVFTT